MLQKGSNCWIWEPGFPGPELVLILEVDNENFKILRGEKTLIVFETNLHISKPEKPDQQFIELLPISLRWKYDEQY